MLEVQPGADRLDQIVAFIPNVQLGSGSQGPSIRGLDSTGVLQNLDGFLGGARPRVAVQVDGRTIGYNEYAFGVAAIWDVEQIELFRSPQTTTQGRNAIAGAIFIRTTDPTYAWEARARAIAGNYATRQASAALSGPLVADQLAFRLAADARLGDPSSRIADRVRGADPDHDDYTLLRLKLLAEPARLPGLRIQASYVHQRSEAPQIEGVRAPFRARRDPLGGYGVFAIDVDSLTGLFRYAPTQVFGTTTTLSYGGSHIRRFALPGLGESRIAARDFSIESVLNWNAPGRWRGLLGIHRLRATLDQAIDLTALIGDGTFADRQDSLGLFGETSWLPLAGLTLTAGLRYQRDRQRRTGAVGPFPLDYDGRFDALLPKLAIAYELTGRLTGGVLIQRAYNPGGTTISLDTGEPDRFGAERLWNYELFARGRFAGGRLQLSANLFRNAIRGAQLPQVRTIARPGGADLLVTEIDNAPRAATAGAELELAWRPSGRLSARAGIGLLDTRIRRTLQPDDPTRGKQFQRAPHFSASAALDWRMTAQLRFEAQFRHNSGYFSDDANSRALRIAESSIAAARLAYTRGPLTLFGYARNVFDAFYLTNLFDPAFGEAGDPRELGVGFEARF